MHPPTFPHRYTEVSHWLCHRTGPDLFGCLLRYHNRSSMNYSPWCCRCCRYNSSKVTIVQSIIPRCFDQRNSPTMRAAYSHVSTPAAFAETKIDCNMHYSITCIGKGISCGRYLSCTFVHSEINIVQSQYWDHDSFGAILFISYATDYLCTSLGSLDYV